MKYFALLTNQGAAILANAAALGTKVNITAMAVGDGGGTLPTPDAAQTKLVGEKRRAQLNSLTIDTANSSQIIAEQVIPEGEGGFWIREIGLFDADGVMIAVANCAETYKPQLAEGSGRTQTVRMIIIVNSTSAVTLKIDPAVVLATRKYVDDAVIEVKAYADSLMAAHLKAADPHPQYAPKESPTLTGTPKTPTAAAGTSTTQIASTAFVQAVATGINNALALKAPLASPALTGTPTAPTPTQTTNSTQLATTAFVKSAIAALVASSPAALDTLKELADALGNDPNFATTMTNALAGKMDIAKNGGDIADVSTFLRNLGLGEAAKRNVGTGANQIPDMSSFPFQRGGAWYRQHPSGMIEQGGQFTVTGSGTAQKVTVNFPIPFPNVCVGIWFSYQTEDPSSRFAGTFSRGQASFVSSVVCPTANTIYYRAEGY